MQQLQSISHALCEIGPAYGYFSEPSKSALITKRDNFNEAELQLEDFGFTIVSGHRYVGGFVGKEEARLPGWLEEKIEEWEFAIDQLTHAAKSAHKQPMWPCRSRCKSNGSSSDEW